MKKELQADFERQSVKLKEREGKLADFCSQTGRRADTFRTQVYGFDRSVSGRAVWGNKRVANGGNGGIIKAEAISGALNSYSKRAEEHAARYYEAVRHMTTDVSKIASNTGYSIDEIQRIKNFIFMEKHDLGRGELEYFDASYEMAQSWQRLIDGKNIQPHDLTLLKHEIMENKLVDLGMTQSDAHIITSKKYNYPKESREYYDTIEKHKKR